MASEGVKWDLKKNTFPQPKGSSGQGRGTQRKEYPIGIQTRAPTPAATPQPRTWFQGGISTIAFPLLAESPKRAKQARGDGVVASTSEHENTWWTRSNQPVGLSLHLYVHEYIILEGTMRFGCALRKSSPQRDFNEKPTKVNIATRRRLHLKRPLGSQKTINNT